MSPALTAPVYRTIKLKDEKGRPVTFKVCVAEEGLYIGSADDKKPRGPLGWPQVYSAVCAKAGR
jgi:hypothetical protein